MQTRHIAVAGALVATCLAYGANALAEASALPPAMTQNGVTYLSGGVGEDESSAIRAAEQQYSLRVLIASKSGEYLSDVDVKIASEKGAKVLAVTTQGPYLLVKLPAGRYSVTAGAGAQARTRNVAVPAHGGASIVFHLD